MHTVECELHQSGHGKHGTVNKAARSHPIMHWDCERSPRRHTTFCFIGAVGTVAIAIAFCLQRHTQAISLAHKLIIATRQLL